jgi:hypothetical protein
MDLALVVGDVTVLEQLVPKTIGLLDHACLTTGQLDPACRLA